MLILLINLIYKLVDIYTFVLVIYALMSWFPGAYDSKVGQFIVKISEPYLGIFDRLNLNIGPINFTVIAAIFFLQLSSQGLVLILSKLMFMNI